MKTKAKEIATLYNGKKIKGKIDTTILRGNIIYQDNNIKVDPGYGSIIRSK